MFLCRSLLAALCGGMPQYLCCAFLCGRGFKKIKISEAALLPVGFAIDRLEGDSIKKISEERTPLGEALAVFRHGCNAKNNKLRFFLCEHCFLRCNAVLAI